MAQRVYFEGGDQTLYTVPHKGGAPVRVASATYSIVRGESGQEHVVVAAGTAATVDAVSTTLTNKAGRSAADPRAVTVASTVGISAHHSYLLTAPDGRVELLKIVAVPSATTLMAAAEIRGQFPTGSTLKGIEVSATFPGTVADDEASLDDTAWVVYWTFPGFAPERDIITLQRAEESQLADLNDLKELDPRIALMGGDQIDAALALSRAHKTFRNDLLLAGANESDLLTGELGKEAVVNLAAFYIYRTLPGEIEQKNAEWYKDRYNEIRAAIQNGALKPHVVHMSKEDDTIDKRNPARLFRANGFI